MRVGGRQDRGGLLERGRVQIVADRVHINSQVKGGNAPQGGSEVQDPTRPGDHGKEVLPAAGYCHWVFFVVMDIVGSLRYNCPRQFRSFSNPPNTIAWSNGYWKSLPPRWKCATSGPSMRTHTLLGTISNLPSLTTIWSPRIILSSRTGSFADSIGRRRRICSLTRCMSRGIWILLLK